MSGKGWIRVRRAALAMVAGVLLAACGGGSEGQAPSAMQAVEQLQARAAVIRANAVPLADAATQLFDAAESLLPELFPGHQETVVAGPIVYRHYPTTHVYVAVMTATLGPFLEGHVYVIGPPFGNTLANPRDLGLLTSIFTPTEPPSAGPIVVSAASLAARNGSYTPVGQVYPNGDVTAWNGQTEDGKFEVDIVWGTTSGTILRAHAWFRDAGDVIKFFGCDGGKSIACTGLTYDAQAKKVTFANVTWHQVEPNFMGTGPDTTVGGGEHLTLNGTLDAK